VDIENPILVGKNMYSDNYGQIDDDQIVGECYYCEDIVQETQDYMNEEYGLFCNNICRKLFVKSFDKL